MRKSLILSAVLVGVLSANSVDLKSCIGCHGKNFEKKALNASAEVNKMSKEDIERALLGYKHGTYGGKLKGIMVSQVKHYSDDDLKKMASDIYNRFGKTKNIEKDKVQSGVDPKIDPKIEEAFYKATRIPKGMVKFEKVVDDKSGLKKIYFKVTGNPNTNIIYVTDKGYIVVGQLFSPEGENITKKEFIAINKKNIEKQKRLERKKLENSYKKAVSGGYGIEIMIPGQNPQGKTYVLFTDPQCPFCKRFEKNILRKLLKDAKEVVVVPFPLKSIHPEAQKRSWYMHVMKDKYRDRAELLHDASFMKMEDIEKKLREIGKDEVSKDFEKKVIDMERESGVRGTPTLLDESGKVDMRSLIRKYSK